MFRFNGFTQKANNAINLAISAAPAGHTYIGSEHLLYGLKRKGVVSPIICSFPGSPGRGHSLFTDQDHRQRYEDRPPPGI